jgi:hypothetical protein
LAGATLSTAPIGQPVSVLFIEGVAVDALGSARVQISHTGPHPARSVERSGYDLHVLRIHAAPNSAQMVDGAAAFD